MSAAKTSVKQSTHTAPREDPIEVWRAYKRTGDPKLRDRLVLTFAPLVKYIVFRKIREMPSSCDAEDFISCGLEALIRSIDRYDPTKGASLEQFAWTRIHGAVLDEMRSGDWAPRSVRRNEREVKRAAGQFHALYGRQPSDDELADTLAVTVDALKDHRADLHRADIGSLNALVQSDDETTVERIDVLPSEDSDCDPEAAAIREDLRTRLMAALSSLPERDRKIAVLLYVHELTLREAGEILGVTASRVCQLRSEMTDKLRLVLQDRPVALAA